MAMLQAPAPTALPVTRLAALVSSFGMPTPPTLPTPSTSVSKDEREKARSEKRATRNEIHRCRHQTKCSPKQMCNTGANCRFAHGPEENIKSLDLSLSTHQTVAGKHFDEIDDWSILPSALCDDWSDTDNASTSSEVAKTDVKHVDSSEEDDDSTALSRSEDAPSSSEEECQEEKPSMKIAATSMSDSESLDEPSLSAVKIHRWDETNGKWIVDFLDLIEEVSTESMFNEQGKHVRCRSWKSYAMADKALGAKKDCEELRAEEVCEASAEKRPLKIDLQAILPNLKASRQARRAEVQPYEPTPLRRPVQTPLRAPPRTPLRPSAAMFCPGVAFSF